MRLRRITLAAVLLVLANACGDSEEAGPEPTVPTTVEDTTTSVAEPAPVTVPRPTTTGVPRTSTTEPTDILSGEARLSGTVVGPSGPVPGATVRVERLVAGTVVTMDVAAGSGAWALNGVRGGSYRVRAWRAPDFAQTQPEVFFLEADEVKTVELRVLPLAELQIRATVPEALTTDPFAVTLLVFTGSVDSKGEVTATTRPGLSVQLAPSAGLGVLGADRIDTDAAGQVTFRVVCRQPGEHSALAVLSVTDRRPVGFPPCPPGSMPPPSTAVLGTTTTIRR